MSVPPQVQKLVERFHQNIDDYKRGKYNETQVRREFIDPFFKALGWDVDNTKGYAEAYKEVVHEDAIKVGRATKAPDYSFRIGGVRKFFLEAKKPSVDIKHDTHPAYQLRRYAWSAKLPLSILTDFEEFAVYDCRIKPVKTDQAANARVMYLTYTDYIDHWPELADIFSPESIRKGSFDKYAETKKAKRGTAEVDAAFLQEIERWRDALARNIALRNTLSQRELNYAVQLTIDRIIFLRIAEDRGIEPYGQLRDLLKLDKTYANLLKLFERADDRYNSGLFHFKPEKGREEPDTLTPGLTVDDKVLKDICKNLYYPDSPYEFSVLTADILGQVYEQFLGKVIRLTPAGRAKIEDKPEVKKAGGVYYTPTYIVDYIVRQTVGKLVEGKTPKQLGGKKPLRVLDPACGSGSFLLGVYQFLLDWYLNWYVNNDPEKWAKKKRNAPIYPAPTTNPDTPNWKLATAERKRILLAHIYGVDIDPQAVEVTKLSLLLKVLEGEDEQSLARQLAFAGFGERVLPDLDTNIKCGNSLIGPDFYAGQPTQMGMFDEDELYRINAFDWQAEFAEIMGDGGFDAVIGNPPYIRMEEFKDLKWYLKSNYDSHADRADLYTYFIERSHKLLKENGLFGMIVSNKFLRANYGKPLREYLSREATINRIADFAGLPVFAGATVRTIVILTSRRKKETSLTKYSPPLHKNKFTELTYGSISVEQAIENLTYEVNLEETSQAVWSFVRPEVNCLLNKLKANYQPLTDYCAGQIYMGIKSGLTEAFVIDKHTLLQIAENDTNAQDIIKPFLNGRNIGRYQIKVQNVHLIYTYHGVDINRYPGIEQHLKPFKSRLEKRATKQKWYELQQPQFRFSKYLDGPKIIFPDIAKKPRFVLDEKGYYISNTVYFIPRRDLYLLGLLNSKLGEFYFVATCAGLEGSSDTYLRFFGQYLASFPIRTIDFNNPTDKARHDKMVALVEQMLDLHKQLNEATIPQARTMLKRRIETTDRQIDNLVYELYGLTDEEIDIVEGRG